MTERRTLFVCSCEDTMPLDTGAIRKTCTAEIETARQLCRAELDRFRSAAVQGGAITVGCTQETPLFEEVAGETKQPAEIRYANIREAAGWSRDAAQAGPKMAALLAAAVEQPAPVPFVNLTSEGVILVYGRDDRAIEAAELLKDHLDVTVLLSKPRAVAPPRINDFPVVKGTINRAKGHLGRFELVVDDYAAPLPSSRSALEFASARDGAVSRCDLILDLSGGMPLFRADDLRDGYLRANPGDPAAVLRAVLKARDLVGSFDKPRYVTLTEHLCVHSRSKITGCTRCLDLCPTGAITRAGDHVAIDPHICAGCGQCAAACPTGAASYALPPAEILLRKLRTLLTAYREAGGTNPVLLFHDEDHGAALIDALARHGEGLPASALPIAVNELTQIGVETIAAAFAYGAAAVRFVQRARPRHDTAGLTRMIALGETVLQGLGFPAGSLATIDTDDPDALGESLRAIAPFAGVVAPARFVPAGGKRDMLRLSLRELHRVAPQPVDVIPLAGGAPFGAIEVVTEGCTLCLACVSACPTGALSDNPDKPMLRFTEDACVQCGLCKNTCPEKVITLVPQIDFRAATASARLIKEEEAFACIRCGKPFGVKSAIDRVIAKLEAKHWMFKGSAERLDVLRMCEDCRVAAVTEQEFDPYDKAARPTPRTTEDYLRERTQRDDKGS